MPADTATIANILRRARLAVDEAMAATGDPEAAAAAARRFEELLGDQNTGCTNTGCGGAAEALEEIVRPTRG